MDVADVGQANEMKRIFKKLTGSELPAYPLGASDDEHEKRYIGGTDDISKEVQDI